MHDWDYDPVADMVYFLIHLKHLQLLLEYAMMSYKILLTAFCFSIENVHFSWKEMLETNIIATVKNIMQRKESYRASSTTEFAYILHLKLSHVDLLMIDLFSFSFFF